MSNRNPYEKTVPRFDKLASILEPSPGTLVCQKPSGEHRIRLVDDTTESENIGNQVLTNVGEVAIEACHQLAVKRQPVALNSPRKRTDCRHMPVAILK
jgi:hypothetical protein